MKTRRQFSCRICTVLFAGSLTFAGASEPATAQTATPVKGGTLVYLDPQPHNSLYPPGGGTYPNGGILNQITDKLTYQNPKTLEIEPWIAESWSTNAKFTEYTFKLRPSVTFSDGTPLDAAAVAKNFDAYGLGNKDKRYPVSEVVNNYERSEVIDPLTVKFYFKEPSPGFLQGTSTIGSGLVSPATLDRSFDELGDATKIIGSGPFVVQSEKLGKEVVLKAREDYNWGPSKSAHQGRAFLDGIKIVVSPEDSVRIGALLSGQADVIRRVQAYDEEQIVSGKYLVASAPTRGVNNGLYFRPDNPLLADVRVRKALLHATNTDEIISTIYSPHYPRATSIIASTATGYVNEAGKLTFDPKLAASLLDDAGWKMGANSLRQKDGAPLILSVYWNPLHPQSKEMLQLVAQQWGQVGVKLNVKSGDPGVVALENLDPLKTPIIHTVVGRADPDVIKSQFHPANRNAFLQKGGLSKNVKTFVDEKLNADLEAIASEVDPAKRLAIVREVQNYIVDQAYMIPVFEDPQVYGASPRLKGLAFEAVGRPSFYDTWLDKR
uniref:TIGR04028 family ABC transporter substrate-binding protein n=1 Tax=Bosea sp. NBC_00436 TaxID=2969620 RepID=A0A9E7ZLF8_9HYPH